MIDTHCHIDFPDFDADREQVINSALKLGLSTLVVPAVAQASWQKTIDICQQYPSCELALGMHPIFIDQHQPHHLSELDQLVSKHKPIAIGEIGLDFYQRELDQEKQLNYFAKQMIIANDHQLPAIIHNRKAHDECIKVLKELNWGKLGYGGIIHAFNGSIQQAEKYIEMGFLLGFGGMITYSRSRKLHALLKQIPLQAIALETDAPDMTVSSHQGERNSPEYLLDIALAISEIKETTLQTVIKRSTENAERILRLNPFAFTA